MSITDLTAKARELKNLQRMAEELEQEIESIKDIIKAEMTARQTEELVAGEYKIRWSTVKSNRFDSSTFKKTHEELYKQYTKESISRRFTIA